MKACAKGFVPRLQRSERKNKYQGFRAKPLHPWLTCGRSVGALASGQVRMSESLGISSVGTDVEV